MDHEKIEAEARAQDAHRAAQERQERLKLEFERHQARTFAGNLFSVEEGQRNTWLRSFEQSPDGTKAQLLLRRGWDASNTGALSLLKTWLSRHHPAVLDALLPNPEDKALEAWMAWRLDQAN